MTKMDEIIESLRQDGIPVDGARIWVSIWTCVCSMCGRGIDHEYCLYVAPRIGSTLHLCLDRAACQVRAKSREDQITRRDIENVERLVILPETCV
jgi:hypothetical protein